MSRRKQENPQPRKRIQTADPVIVQDVLTCGVCQKDFALSDIVKFIQHKVHSCNKENCVYYGDQDFEKRSEGNTDIFRSRRSSVSATLCKKDSESTMSTKYEETYGVSKLFLDPHENSSPDVDRTKDCFSIDPEEALRKRSPVQLSSPVEGAHTPRRVVDADTNTTSTEPSNHVCLTCKQSFTSAWMLVQHAQRIHGMKIYVETNNKESVLIEGSRSTSVSFSPTNASSPLAVTPVNQDQPISHSVGLEPLPFPNLQLPRIPLGERQFGPALNTPNYLPRPSSHGFRMDLFSDQYHRLNHLGGIGLSPFDSYNPFDRSRFDRPRPPHIGLSFESHLDFYSQRLRQLAGATSPNTTTSSRKLTSPYAHPVTSSQPSPHPSTPSSTPQPISTPLLSQSLSPKPTQKPVDQSESSRCKSCEFCGKSFRFQSNLIVHRRSHTGEKPFKCHICNHACTQASKLKRHMKTHWKSSPDSAENASVCSARSTPDSPAKDSGGQNNDGEDEDGSEEQAENENEELEDEEELEEDSEDIAAEDLTTKSSTKNPSYPYGGNENGDKDSCTKQSATPQARQSLLGEVMEKIGLNDIQQYNEAYKQALEENRIGRSLVKKERPSSAPMDRSSPRKSNIPPENGLDRQHLEEGNNSLGQPLLNLRQSVLPDFDGHFEDKKRLRLDLGDHQRENLYAGLWLPSVNSSRRNIFLGSHYVTSSETDQRSNSESALLAVTSHLPGTSTPITTLPSKPKEKIRNDTCEFCGKVFKNCSNLTVHRRSHTGEKPYKCELCSYACAQSSKLTRHMKTHGRMGKDVYRCRFCGMPFSVPSTLEKHMRKCVVNQNAYLTDRDTDSRDNSTSGMLPERDSVPSLTTGRDSDSRETS